MTLPFRTIWIIGASTGIGRECALACAREGVTVIASARSLAGLENLAALAPGQIHPVVCDVADAASVRAARTAVAALVGLPDALLFAAATWTNAPGLNATAEAVAPVLEVNVLGALRIIDSVLPDMCSRGSGRLVLISSVAGFRGLPRGLAYGCSKAALTHIAECLRLACAPTVTIQCVHPGFVKTPLTDSNDFTMPFLMTAPDAAQRILAGMRGDSFEITFPRRFTWLLKLFRMLPYALYFPLVRRLTSGTKNGNAMDA
jgi:NAD(P)-dependent dehydrogenase (short-subunit alcohol dehydrogenase family)